MSEENVRVNGFLAWGHQLGGQPLHACAAVKNQKVAVGSGHLDAGGIAAEVVRARPGRGDRPPRSPETYFHESAAPVRAASTDRKFDPTVGARPANCGGCARIQGLLVLRLGAS